LTEQLCQTLFFNEALTILIIYVAVYGTDALPFLLFFCAEKGMYVHSPKGLIIQITLSCPHDCREDGTG